MLDSLITSKTRVKLLTKFFLNSATRSYLRNLEVEFGESTNSIRVELNRLEETGLLKSEYLGNRRYFFANKSHPLFYDISSIVRKYVGIDQIIENIINRLGNLKSVYIAGSLARGLDTGVIQIIVVGEHIDREYLTKLVSKAEVLINKKISYLAFKTEAFQDFSSDRIQDLFLIWNNE